MLEGRGPTGIDGRPRAVARKSVLRSTSDDVPVYDRYSRIFLEIRRRFCERGDGPPSPTPAQASLGATARPRSLLDPRGPSSDSPRSYPRRGARWWLGARARALPIPRKKRAGAPGVAEVILNFDVN